MTTATNSSGGAPTKVKKTPAPGNSLGGAGSDQGGANRSMAAGWAVAGRVSYQQPFHPKMLNIHTGVDSSQGKNQLTKGYVSSDDGDYPFGVRFLYNPTQIETDWSIDPNTAVLPASQLPTNDPSTAFIGGMGNLSFSLLFDRTFECWDRSYANTQAGKLGCYEDVRQFYLLMGILPKAKAGTSTFDVPASPMVPVPLYVSFGGFPALVYYGRIMSFTVTYTHWTQNMTPVRAAIALTMMMMIPTAKVSAQQIAVDAGAATIAKDVAAGNVPHTKPSVSTIISGTGRHA